MVDAVIPPLPPGFTLDQPTTPAVPPLPPGFTLDAPQAAPSAPASPDVTVGGNGEPTRITVRPEAPQPRPVSLLPSSVGGAARDFRIGAQGVGAGLRDVALMPFDLAAGAQNLVTSGVNKLFGTDIPMATPASRMAEKVTAPFAISEKDMTPNERLFENINRFGTQGVAAGSALATRAPAILSSTAPAETIGGRMLDTVARPYADSPLRTVAGDAAVGAGAGVGANMAQEYAPNSQLAQVAGPLAGGISAAGVQGAIEGLGGLIRNLFRQRTDVNAPLSPKGAPYSVNDTNRAAEKLQSQTTFGRTEGAQQLQSPAPRAVAQDIRENATELNSPTRPGETPVAPSQTPTSGLLSRDAGLVTAEQQARMKNSAPFIGRDQSVKEAAAERIDSLRDPNADVGAVPRVAEAAKESQMAPLEQRVQQFEDINNRAGQMRQQQGAEFGAVANSEAKANASRRLDRAVVDENYVPARAEKNRQFDEAPGRTEQLPADDVFAAIDRVRASANGLAPGTLPNDFMRRLDALRPQIDPATGANIGGPGTALGGDLADLRKFVGTAREQAQNSGNFDLADNLGQLQRALNRTITEAPGYAEANANYGRFAERFRPERNDEGAKFTKEIDRGGQQPDGTLNRGATPPSETAGRFLSSPEKTQALNRMLAGAPSEQAGQAAVRDYMRSDFATSALNADGTINPARAAAWSRNNADVLAQFPALRTEFDNVIAQARRGDQLSNDARAFLDQARRTAKATEADIDRGAIGTLLKEDPRDVAANILGGKWSAEKKLDEINALVKNDAAAQRGWKAAFSDELYKRVTNTKKTGETYEVAYARLAKEFKANEALLAKVYSPEEMNTLRQGHKMLGYFKEAEKRATVGSQTAERLLPEWFQLGLRHVYGDLRGGGIAKRLKLMLELLPSNKQSAEELVHMAWFDPNLAAYLLEKPVAKKFTLQYNPRLQRVLAVDNAARGDSEN